MCEYRCECGLPGAPGPAFIERSAKTNKQTGANRVVACVACAVARMRVAHTHTHAQDERAGMGTDSEDSGTGGQLTSLKREKGDKRKPKTDNTKNANLTKRSNKAARWAGHAAKRTRG